MFRSLFRRLTQKKTSNALVDGEFLWCIVGNIVDHHQFGENKEIRRGTKHFRPGAKVYCIPEFPGMGHESVRVIGKPRGANVLINVIIETRRIKNFRLQKVYSPSLFDKISSQKYYRVSDNYRLSYEELEQIMHTLSSYTEEIEAPESN